MPTRLRVFFGAVKTKRTNAVESKIADYVKKEDQLRKSIFFKICKEIGGLGPRGREPPKGFRLEDATLKSMISEEDASFNCDICGIIFAGRDESEQHLRGEHLEKYKSLFARECF